MILVIVLRYSAEVLKFFEFLNEMHVFYHRATYITPNLLMNLGIQMTYQHVLQSIKID